MMEARAEAGGTEMLPLSERLNAFVAENPIERTPILNLMQAASRAVPPGARVLDVGAGDAPYRELFNHARYQTSDWALSQYESPVPIDYVASAHELPVGDDTFDAVLFTQVLEHVPNPQAVLNELLRVLKPECRLYLSAPFVWEIHEAPYDYFRYTAGGLHSMLTDAGFDKIDISPRTDVFETLAQQCRESAASLGHYPDGRDSEREAAAEHLRGMADSIARFAGLEVGRRFPLGYAVIAEKPGACSVTQARRGDRSQLLRKADRDHAASFVTIAALGEMLADPSLMSAYATTLGADQDALLFVYAPDVYIGDAEQTMAWLLRAAGSTSDAPRWVIVRPEVDITLTDIVRAADAVLSNQPPHGLLAELQWVHRGNVGGARRIGGVH